MQRGYSVRLSSAAFASHHLKGAFIVFFFQVNIITFTLYFAAFCAYYYYVIYILLFIYQSELSMYSGTFVFKLDLFLKTILEIKCLKTETMFPTGINMK